MEFTLLYDAFISAILAHVYTKGNQQQALALEIKKSPQEMSTFISSSKNPKLETFWKVYLAIGKDPRLLIAILRHDITPELAQHILDLIEGKKKLE